MFRNLGAKHCPNGACEWEMVKAEVKTPEAKSEPETEVVKPSKAERGN